jgi:hypothetical protein
LLVVMVSGIAVVFAAFALIDITLHQTSRSTDRIDATQRGRVWLESLEQELNSGCINADVSPVQAASSTGIAPAVSSDGSDLVFVTGFGSGQTVTPVEHVVSYSGGTLTDASYANTGGNGPTASSASTYTFATTPTTKRVLTNVQSVGFTYYSFSNPANNPTNSLQGPVALTTPLSSAWPTAVTNSAYNVARIDLALTVQPTDGSSDQYTWVHMNDSVVFRLTPPISGTTNNPCD